MNSEDPATKGEVLVMKLFALEHNGTQLEVEYDQAPVFWARARLIVDGRAVDERGLLWGKSFLRSAETEPIRVRVSAGFFGVKKPSLIDGSASVPFTKIS